MGSTLLTEALKYYCGTNVTANMTYDSCIGFTVYPPDKFYEIDYSILPLAFETEYLPKFIKLTLKSTILHFADSVNHHKPLNVSEKVGYGVMAKFYCPGVYDLFKNEFE